MGRRRSKVLDIQRRLKGAYLARRRRELKPPFRCPLCLEPTVYFRKRGKLIFIYCAKENTGEVMPLHPTFGIIDYYNFWRDKRIHVTYGNDPDWQQYLTEYKEPIFKFPILRESVLQNLQNNVTLGKVVAIRVV